MKKYENYKKEELSVMCAESESFRELAIKIGYNPNGGSCIRTVKQMCEEYGFDTSHFKGRSHTKNVGKFRTPIEKYLNNEQSITSWKLKNRLVAEGYFQERCCSCGLTEWLGQPIPLELHHKDGDKTNNSLENLELRCPNCHYFTDTYKSKNRKN